MSFSNVVKLSVKHRSHFSCCLCKTLGIEIHHIVPQEDGGPDIEDNAAPLCPSCHETYGANPQKRKFIREARDFWYELCDARYSSDKTQLTELRGLVEQTASKTDLVVLTDTILNAVWKLEQRQENRESLTRHLGSEDEVIRKLTLHEFISTLYSDTFKEQEDHYEVLFDSRAWHDPEYELVDYMREFLLVFGTETARRLCLFTQRDAEFHWTSFTEEDFERLLKSLHVSVMLLVDMVSESIPVAMGFRPDGKLVWLSTEGRDGVSTAEA